jgi:hypothetical protein
VLLDLLPQDLFNFIAALLPLGRSGRLKAPVRRLVASFAL